MFSSIGPFALALVGCAKPPPLSQIEQTIFTRSCQFSACHQGGSPAGGLNLQTAAAYQQLVNASGQMAIRAADIHDEQVAHSVERMVALLVPLVTILMGLVVAGIVGSLLTAMLSLNDLAL